MTDWTYVELSDVALMQSGGTPSKANPEFWGEELPWISARDMHEMRLHDTHLKLTAEGAKKARVMPAGTVFVLTRGMTLLRDLPVIISSVPAAFNQDVKSLRAGPELLPDFLAYSLIARKHELLQTVTLAGHGTGRLDSARLSSFPVPVPPLPEQRMIVKILGAWDDAIEKTTHQRQLASLRYTSGVNTFVGRDSDNSMKLGIATKPIGRRNSAGALGRDLVMGVSNAEGIIPMREQTIAADISRYLVLPPRGFAYNPMRINVGSISMSRRPYDVLVSPDYVAFTCDEDVLLPEYLDHVLETTRWLHDVNAGGSGSVRSRTYYDDLAAISIQSPDLPDQRQVVAALDTMREELVLLDRKIMLLREQKRGLMQKLLTGDIRVSGDPTEEATP